MGPSRFILDVRARGKVRCHALSGDQSATPEPNGFAGWARGPCGTRIQLQRGQRVGEEAEETWQLQAFQEKKPIRMRNWYECLIRSRSRRRWSSADYSSRKESSAT